MLRGFLCPSQSYFGSREILGCFCSDGSSDSSNRFFCIGHGSNNCGNWCTFFVFLRFHALYFAFAIKDYFRVAR